jgi:TFIIF-interacting CTD phosphatase-like protein
LEPAENHKGDVHSFWNPVTRCSVQSRTGVLLKQKYGEFYKISKSDIAKQVAGIMDPINEMYDEDEDVIPEDEEGNQINPDDDYVFPENENNDIDFFGLEDNNHNENEVPDVVQQRFAGIPREIQNLQTFF